MAVVPLAPDGVYSGASNFTATGAASLNAALSDNSDASYVQKAVGLTGTYSCALSFGTTTVGATQRVKRVRVTARASTPTTSGKIDVALGTRINSVNYYHSALAIRGQNTAAANFVQAYWSATPAGTAWDQATIDGLRVQITEYNDTTDRGSVYELDVDVDVANQPSTTVSAPSGSVTTTATPTLTWTYTDPDSDVQSFYEAKVFTAAQYGAVGFSPATSTSTWESGEIASNDTEVTISTLLLPGAHRAYVRTGKSINGEPFWSDWAYSAFTITVTQPTATTLVAAWDSSTGKATLTLTGAAPSGFASQYFQMQRSDDSGTTWDYIRDGSSITPSASYTATVFDYEAPRGITARYRARAVGVNGEVQIPSAWSSIPQVLVTNDGTWWLKAVADPTLNVGSLRVSTGLSVSVVEENSVFRPLGRSYPIVVSSVIGGYDGSLTITAVDDEWDGIIPVVMHQGTLLLQDPLPRQKYVRVVNRSWTETYAAGRPVRAVQLDYVEVEG